MYDPQNPKTVSGLLRRDYPEYTRDFRTQKVHRLVEAVDPDGKVTYFVCPQDEWKLVKLKEFIK